MPRPVLSDLPFGPVTPTIGTARLLARRIAGTARLAICTYLGDDTTLLPEYWGAKYLMRFGSFQIS